VSENSSFVVMRSNIDTSKYFLNTLHLTMYSYGIQKKNPTAENYMNRALCYLHSRNWDLVIIDLRRILVNNPYHVKSHYLLGLVSLELKDFNEAIRHLQRGMEDSVIPHRYSVIFSNDYF